MEQFGDKICLYCNKKYTPKKIKGIYKRQKFCSKLCKAQQILP